MCFLVPDWRINYFHRQCIRLIFVHSIFCNVPSLPAREKKIQISEQKSKIPRLEQLFNEENRIITLHHFANHELMAIELFAWAILKFQDAPSSIRFGLYRTLLEEQTHLKMYLSEMKKGEWN